MALTMTDYLVRLQSLVYRLRPETAESLFVLHQATGHPMYREWGWKMFQTINTQCRTVFGYASYADVRFASDLPGVGLLDEQEPHFLAETLKYLYLLQSPDHDISLMTHVFNTNGHPTPILTAANAVHLPPLPARE